MECSPTLCFTVFECKRNNSSKKNIKLAKAQLSRHNFRMSRHNLNRTNRSYVATSNSISQQRIEAELKLEVKNVATFHNFVVTQNEIE